MFDEEFRESSTLNSLNSLTSLLYIIRVCRDEVEADQK